MKNLLTYQVVRKKAQKSLLSRAILTTIEISAVGISCQMHFLTGYITLTMKTRQKHHDVTVYFSTDRSSA